MLLMIFCLLGFGSRFAVMNPRMIDLHYLSLSLSLTLPRSPTLSIIPMVEAISWKGKDPWAQRSLGCGASRSTGSSYLTPPNQRLSFFPPGMQNQ